jgi:hypothetical protein
MRAVPSGSITFGGASEPFPMTALRLVLRIVFGTGTPATDQMGDARGVVADQ